MKCDPGKPDLMTREKLFQELESFISDHFGRTPLSSQDQEDDEASDVINEEGNDDIIDSHARDLLQRVEQEDYFSHLWDADIYT